jgi:NarL family two-component system response regulator LiaR
LKKIDPAELFEQLRGLARGEAALSRLMANKLLYEFTHTTRTVQVEAALTPREQQVLQLVARGLTNREIAETLVVSEETVKSHVGNILAKLHLAHRTQAALYALKQGLVSLDEIEEEGS